ncbi:hypothetical protein [Kineosporia sp. A_224]|uniref:hypothetical protein n=1 Tax=Kineosporia sp. A_224 TaxID=1962180 RepID=UPI000B4BEB51|nr:hypothetical protein [Kineosporia sp. A_224]
MCPTSSALGALRAAAVAGPSVVQVRSGSEVRAGGELTRALDVTARVMAAANDRMTAALADTDLAGYERASLSFDAAERRFDALCGAACEAGYYLGFASVPDKPTKVSRFTRRDRFGHRLLARLRVRRQPTADAVRFVHASAPR